MYGHSKIRCNNNITCVKCGGEGHTADNCLESVAKCLHCGGPHRVKNKRCSVQVKEQVFLDIQNKHKVGKRRARRIYEGHDALDITKNKNAFATDFICKIDEVMKRKLTPWALEKCLHNELGAKQSSIRSGGKDNFIVHVTEESSSRLITQIKTINYIPITFL